MENCTFTTFFFKISTNNKSFIKKKKYFSKSYEWINLYAKLPIFEVPEFAFSKYKWYNVSSLKRVFLRKLFLPQT